LGEKKDYGDHPSGAEMPRILWGQDAIFSDPKGEKTP